MKQIDEDPKNNNPKISNFISISSQRISELEIENERLGRLQQDKLSGIEEKLALICDVYSCIKDDQLDDPKDANTSSSPKKKKSSKTNQKNGDGCELKRNLPEFDILREQNKLLLQELQDYKAAIWLQSRTINELTSQQNDLLQSIGEYRKGCASRLERITELGKRQEINSSFVETKGCQTEQLGVSKEIQCFLPEPQIEAEMMRLKKQQDEHNDKFESIIKMMMADTSQAADTQAKRLKSQEGGLYKRLDYEELEDNDIDQIANNISFYSSSAGQTDFTIEQFDVREKPSDLDDNFPLPSTKN